jgi:hypothetical protein
MQADGKAYYSRNIYLLAGALFQKNVKPTFAGLNGNGHGLADMGMSTLVNNMTGFAVDGESQLAAQNNIVTYMNSEKAFAAGSTYADPKDMTDELIKVLTCLS